MLRYQPAIGPSLDTQVTRYLSLPAVPDLPRLRPAHPARARGRRARRAGRRGPAARCAGAVNVAARGHDRAGPHDPAGGPAAAAAAGPAVRARHRASRRRLGLARALGGLPAAAALRPRRWTSTGSSRRSAHRPRYSTLEARRGLGGGGGVTEPGRGGASMRAPARGARRRASSCPRRSARGAAGAAARARATRSSAAAPARGRLRARTSGASTRSSPTWSSRSSTSSTTAGGGSRSRAPTTCPPTGARCWPPTTPGILPWDATMISVALLREHPLPRHPRFLVLNWAFDLPWVSVAIRKVGGVVASPYNALRLLEQDQLVAVFPEGVKGTGKPFARALPAPALRPRRLRGARPARRRADRAGRGGRAARRSTPSSARSPPLARAIGAPFFPVTPTFPWLGPARGGAAAVEVADRVLRADRDGAATGPTPRPTARSCSSCPSRCATRSSRRSTRTWSGAAPRSSD